MLGLSTVEVFVVLIAFSSLLVNVWLASAVLERHRLKRATAVLAAISGIIMAWLVHLHLGFQVVGVKPPSSNQRSWDNVRDAYQSCRICEQPMHQEWESSEVVTVRVGDEDSLNAVGIDSELSHGD